MITSRHLQSTIKEIADYPTSDLMDLLCMCLVLKENPIPIILLEKLFNFSFSASNNCALKLCALSLIKKSGNYCVELHANVAEAALNHLRTSAHPELYTRLLIRTEMLVSELIFILSDPSKYTDSTTLCIPHAEEICEDFNKFEFQFADKSLEINLIYNLGIYYQHVGTLYLAKEKFQQILTKEIFLSDSQKNNLQTKLTEINNALNPTPLMPEIKIPKENSISIKIVHSLTAATMIGISFWNACRPYPSQSLFELLSQWGNKNYFKR